MFEMEKDITQAALNKHCWFCSSLSTSSLSQNVYKVQSTKRRLNGTVTRYLTNTVKIPICDECNHEKDRLDRIEGSFYLGFLCLGIILLLYNTLDRTWSYFLMGLFWGLISVNFLWAFLAKKISQSMRRSEEDFDYSDFPIIKVFKKEGWHLGEKP